MQVHLSSFLDMHFTWKILKHFLFSVKFLLHSCVDCLNPFFSAFNSYVKCLLEYAFITQFLHVKKFFH